MKSDLLPSTSVLRSFEAAAKHQSYTVAAEELGVTQGAISRQVRELETLLGVALFRPAGRGVQLTDAGHSFAARLAPDLDRLRQSVILARASGAAGKMLSIAVLPTFGARWLAPRLPKFQSKYPDVQLTFKSRYEPFDLVAEGVDLAIQYGREDWIGSALSELCSEDLTVVAAPQLLARLPVADQPDPRRLPRLHLLSRRDAWAAYFAEQGQDCPDVAHGTQFDQFSTLIGAALHGLGVAIVPSFLIETELKDGSLVVLGRSQNASQKYFVATRAGEANPLAEAFKTWVRSEARLINSPRGTSG